MSQRGKNHDIIALAKQMCYYLTNVCLEQPFLNKQVEYLYIQTSVSNCVCACSYILQLLFIDTMHAFFII